MPHVFETVTLAASTFAASARTRRHAARILACKSQWSPSGQSPGATVSWQSPWTSFGTGRRAAAAPGTHLHHRRRGAPVEQQLKAVVGVAADHLVGHSYGALVALRLAQRQPRASRASPSTAGRIAVLADDDPAHASLRAVAERVQRHIGAGRNQDAAQAFVDHWNGGGYFASLPTPTRHAIAKRVAKIMLDFQASLRWPAHASELRAIAAPALLLVGTEGQAVTQRIAARIVGAIPDCRLHACDAGHLGPIAAPATVNPWIEAFIDECERNMHRRAPAAATA